MRFFLFLFCIIERIYCKTFNNVIDVPFQSITQKDFDISIEKNDYTVIIFFVPWCGHSLQVLENFYNVYQQNFLQQSLSIIKIDGSTQKNLTKQLSIHGFPTVKIYKKYYKKFTDYQFDITPSEIAYHLNLEFFYKIPHYENYDAFEKTNKKFIILLLADLSKFTQIQNEFIKTAHENIKSLYHFATAETMEQYFTQKFFSADTDQSLNTAYIIMIKKFEYLDHRLNFKIDDAQQFSSLFFQFFHKNYKPLIIKSFNHKVRKAMIDKQYIGIAMFYRKKAELIDGTAKDSFYNLTRDIRQELMYKSQNSLYFNQISDIVNNTSKISQFIYAI